MMRLNKEIIGLYKKTSLWQKFHIIIRYWLCPFDEVEKIVPQAGKILDLGCGYGIFANILTLQSSRRQVLGLDQNARRIAVANASLSASRNIKFKIAEALSYPLDADINCVTLIDLPLETDRKLLTKIYAALPPKGALIIKSISRHPGWKYYLTLVHMATVDKILSRSFKSRAYFLKEEGFICLLQEIGFKVKFLNIDKGYPYSHCLYVCNKD